MNKNDYGQCPNCKRSVMLWGHKLCNSCRNDPTWPIRFANELNEKFNRRKP